MATQPAMTSQIITAKQNVMAAQYKRVAVIGQQPASYAVAGLPTHSLTEPAQPPCSHPPGDYPTSYRGLDWNLEERLAHALQEIGWTVVTLSPKEYKLVQPDWLVRQWCPRVLDAVTGKRRAYRLDFAHPGTKAGFEVDGYNRLTLKGKRAGKGGHITWSGFHADRERDRNLTLNGWRVMRCGPDDLETPTRALIMAHQFTRLIKQLEGILNDT